MSSTRATRDTRAIRAIEGFSGSTRTSSQTGLNGLRIALILLALASPFLFPWQFTLVLGFAAGLVFPPLALFIGALMDVLYHPAGSWLWGTIAGIISFGIILFVRYIVRSRIM